MRKVLLTGFGPFGNDKVNPALEVIKKLDKQELKIKKEAIVISTIELPVVFGKAIEIFRKAVPKVNPELILSIGQAGGRAVIAIERVGININDASIADNEGNKPQDEYIEPSGPAAYFTTINIRKTCEEIKKAKIPALISNSAGTYVCNNIIYGALHFLMKTKKYSTIKYGFIHIPYIPSQIATKEKPIASMSLDNIIEAIKIAIRTNL